MPDAEGLVGQKMWDTSEGYGWNGQGVEQRVRAVDRLSLLAASVPSIHLRPPTSDTLTKMDFPEAHLTSHPSTSRDAESWTQSPE